VNTHVADIILSKSKDEYEIVAENNEEHEEKPNEEDLVGEFPEEDDTIEKIKVPVIGPLVSNQVKGMFDNEEGRGKMAISANGKWDGVNIW